MAVDEKKSHELSRQYTNMVQQSSKDKDALNQLKSMLRNANSLESKLYYSDLLRLLRNPSVPVEVITVSFRYTDGSICSLVFLEKPHMGFDGFRLEVFV